MTATSHFLAGASLAALIGEPLLVLPLAFVSHFVLDALPHFGIEVPEEHSPRRGKIIIQASIVDGLFVIAAIVFVLMNFPAWYALAGVVAYSPDFAWWYKFTIQEKWGKVPPSPLTGLNKFHSRIQRYEQSWAVIVDIVFIISLTLYLIGKK